MRTTTRLPCTTSASTHMKMVSEREFVREGGLQEIKLHMGVRCDRDNPCLSGEALVGHPGSRCKAVVGLRVQPSRHRGAGILCCVAKCLQSFIMLQY